MPFPLDATDAEQDEPVWVLAAYEIVPGADDGGYSPLCDRATVRQCRKVADRLSIGGLVGD